MGGPQVDIAFVTAAHARSDLLDTVLHQTVQQFPGRTGLRVKVLLLADRPLPRVAEVVERWRSHPDVVVRVPDVGALDPKKGYNCSQMRNQALDMIDELDWNPAWVSSRDDDWLFGPGYEALGTLLRDESIWAWRGVNLFVWDRDDNVNVAQQHQFVVLGRHKPGWRRDLRLTDGEAAEVAAHVRQHPEALGWLPCYLVDYGASSLAARQQLYSNCINGGRLHDEFVDRWLKEPVLQPRELVMATWPDPQEFWQWQVKNWPYSY